ncbi:MAG: sodium:proton antiporter, partial [Bacteroidota bacterium]
AGAVLTNFIGTTGASILLIRPYMRVNRYRLKPYHIVFFIFFVSNIGGLLTPIGDPPLFIGFLKGVPFLWTFENLVPHWCIAIAFLTGVFYLFERKNTALNEVDTSENYSRKIKITGAHNFLWLAAIIASVFIDPNTIDGIPYLEIHGKKISYIRELLQLAIAFTCYQTADKKAMDSNRFSFEPIKEVSYLFFGIFLAMIPALQFLETSGKGANLSAGFMYWSTGIFSSMLDNAPTYLNFLTLALTAHGLSIADVNHVRDFVAGNGKIFVAAISVGAVFFGALTYIGNGPNFMVKAIAEEQGVKMPGFFQYMLKYSLPVLLPLFIFIWLCFFT